MKRVFADTLYWAAIIWPRNPWHSAAIRARTAAGLVHLVTTDEVLTEFLNAFAGRGPSSRRLASQMVHQILHESEVTVVPQSRLSFLAGLSFYESRSDKGYSLTDCISMNVMRSEGISDILTNDHHFAQEGFSVLIER